MAPVTLTEVTDPFCTWCWGAEPLLRRVEETYRDQVEVEFAMGGLVEDFDDFRDAANGITEPEDVVPHWEEASRRHGMPVDPDVWLENPPRSSHPASIAYEAAELRDGERAGRYLRRLREAVATERRDVSRESVLADLAVEVGFDRTRFAEALDGDAAREAFEADRRFARRNRATAFPSFRVARGDEATWVRGFQPFDALRDALAQVAPDLEEHDPRPIAGFVARHGRVATREVAEVYGMSSGRTIQALRALEAEGAVSAVKRGNGLLWEPAGAQSPSTDLPGRTRDPDTPDGARCSLVGDCTADPSE